LTPGEGRRPGALGLPLVVVVLAGLGIAGYLLVVRLLGEAPACGPGGGCELVQDSEYSAVLGIPVAAWGTAWSLVVLAGALAWWRRADRRALLLVYGMALPGTLAVAYLTYLELFVIEAICPWCVAYAATVVATLVITALAMRRSGRDYSSPA